MFNAIAKRAQRADCHDSCDGELEMGVMGPLFEIECVALREIYRPSLVKVRCALNLVFAQG
jgi:hypothetical protein